MKHAFYITAFNDPKECAHAMEQFTPLFQECDRYLSNQSTEEFHAEYDALCQKYGYKHLKWANQGATDAKRKVVQHAASIGAEFISQISEDFELTPLEETNPSVANGREFFLQDAMKILVERPKTSFVHWTYIRSGIHRGYFWSRERGANTRFRRHPNTTLHYLEGEVSMFNWPYTGKVKDVHDLWQQASLHAPSNDLDIKDNANSAGEWALTQVSLGKGVCLVAHPVRHTDREVKPEGSLP